MGRYTSSLLPVLIRKEGRWTVRAIPPGTRIRVDACADDPRFALVTLDGETFHALLEDVQQHCGQLPPRRRCEFRGRQFRATTGT